MIFPKVSVSEWAERYGIPTDPTACIKCGETKKMDTPFAHGTMRGLIAQLHECGEEFRQSVFVTNDRDVNEKLGEFVSRFYEDSQRE